MDEGYSKQDDLEASDHFQQHDVCQAKPQSPKADLKHVPLFFSTSAVYAFVFAIGVSELVFGWNLGKHCK
jgi:hypothetical protein